MDIVKRINRKYPKKDSGSSLTKKPTKCLIAYVNHQAMAVEGRLRFNRGLGFEELKSEPYRIADKHLLASLGHLFVDQPADIIRDGEVKLAEDKPWSSIMALFKQSPSLEMEGDVTREKKNLSIAHGDSVGRSFTNFFKSRNSIIEAYIESIGEAKSTVARETKKWFEDSLTKASSSSEGIEMDIASIVGEQADALVGILQLETKKLSKSEYLEEERGPSDREYSKGFLDIGVMRFCDYQKPYIQVHHVRLISLASFDGKKSTVTRTIEGEFHQCKFRPRKEFLDKLGTETMNIAVDRARRLLEGPEKTPQRDSTST